MERLRGVLDYPLVSLGETRVTLWLLAYVLVLLALLLWLAKRLQAWIAGPLLAKSALDSGARHAAGALARYTVLALGLLVIVQTAGIDLTPFTVLAGAIGIGIGFGLQNVVSNFFAGLIIMFERPIKLGDRIEVDGVEGATSWRSARAAPPCSPTTTSRSSCPTRSSSPRTWSTGSGTTSVYASAFR